MAIWTHDGVVQNTRHQELGHMPEAPSRCLKARLAAGLIIWKGRQWGNMSLDLGHGENSVSHLLSLDCTRALPRLYQTSSFPPGTIHHWINCYKQHHAKAIGTWVQRQNRSFVPPRSVPRNHLNNASTCSKTLTRHICFKTHSFNPVWQWEGFVWGPQYQAGWTLSDRPCRCFQLNAIIKLAAQHG